MKISVIMLTYNRDQYIRNIINDILGQTINDFEFIIVDNGSVDSSGQIIDALALSDKRIKAVHLDESVSIGAARNIGFRQSSGEFITYVDDDDRVEKDYLEFLYKLIEKTNADFSACGTVEVVNGKIHSQCVFDGTYELTAEKAVKELLLRERIRAGMPAKLFKRKILEKFSFREDCKHEDIHTTYKYLSIVEKAIINGTPKYKIMRHGDNVSYFTSDITKISLKQLEEYLDAYRERTLYLTAKFPELKYFVQYSEWSYMLSMCHKIIYYQIGSCKKPLREMVIELTNHKNEFYASGFLKEFEKDWMKMYIET